jgi:polysaccharide export outer membrane protein
MKLNFFVLLFAAGCASAVIAGSVDADPLATQRTDVAPKASGTLASLPASKAGEAAPPGDAPNPSDEEYRIGANDLLELSVFQVKELDRAVRVNTRGLITLPLIGAIQAAGLSATELEERIAEKLKKDYLQDPQVSVFIKEFTSQRITVEGQVEKAGIYPLTGRTTLLQAIALAGGLKELGEDTKIKVFHLEKSGARKMQIFDLEQVRDGTIMDPAVKNNDIVVVDKATGRAIFKTITDTLRGFITLGTL